MSEHLLSPADAARLLAGATVLLWPVEPQPIQPEREPRFQGPFGTVPMHFFGEIRDVPMPYQPGDILVAKAQAYKAVGEKAPKIWSLPRRWRVKGVRCERVSQHMPWVYSDWKTWHPAHPFATSWAWIFDVEEA